MLEHQTASASVAPRTQHGLIALTCIIVACLALGCGRTEVVAGFPDSFVGVGVELRVEGDHPVVVRTLQGGPAHSAGLLAGDVITAVNSSTTEGISLGETVMRLRGAPDSQVTLTVTRGKDRITVVVRRKAMAKASGGYKPR